jgi:hypothetical protein
MLENPSELLHQIDEKLDALAEHMHAVKLDIREIKTRLELLERENMQKWLTEGRLDALERA